MNRQPVAKQPAPTGSDRGRAWRELWNELLAPGPTPPPEVESGEIDHQPQTPAPRRQLRLPQLRRLRQRRALSQRDLAKLADVTERTIRRLETGETNSRPSTTRKLAKALRVRPEELMGPDEVD
jgi:DNA-binding XRE family transcriptional regulator